MTITRIRNRLLGAPGPPDWMANGELAFNEVDEVLYYGRGVAADGRTATQMVPIGGGGALIAGSAPTAPLVGDLWWDSIGGNLYVYYDDGNSQQWVVANTAAAAGPYLQLSGGIINPGPLTITKPNADPGIRLAPIGMYDPAPAGSSNTVFANVLSALNVGTSGGNYTDTDTLAGMFMATIYGAPNNNVVGSGSWLNYHSTAGGTGQHCASIAYAFRDMAAPQPTTTVTVSLTNPDNILHVADVSKFQVPYAMPILVNGTPYYQVGVSGTSGPGTITVALRLISVADGAAGNIVTGNNNPGIWGTNISAVDNTGLKSSQTNSIIGMELDLKVSGLDDAGTIRYGRPDGIRSALTIAAGQASPSATVAEVATGIVVTASTANFAFKRVIEIGANTSFSQAGFDTRDAVQQSGANAIWLGDGHFVAFSADALFSIKADVPNDTMVLHSPSGGAFDFRTLDTDLANISGYGITLNGAYGINYVGAVPVGQQFFVAFGWSGQIEAYVNTSHVSTLASQGWVGGNFLAAGGGTMTGALTTPQVTLRDTSGPSIRGGAGLPAGVYPAGSLWLRTDGAAGQHVYVSAGGGTWAPIAGV